MIKCGRCKAKALKYNKIGQGQVLRCYEKRIKKYYGYIDEGQLKCSSCHNILGVLKNGHIKMIQKEFTYSGRKIRS